MSIGGGCNVITEIPPPLASRGTPPPRRRVNYYSIPLNLVFCFVCGKLTILSENIVIPEATSLTRVIRDPCSCHCERIF